MTNIPRYLKKYRARDMDGSPWESFSSYLDQLDAKDWVDLLEDLLLSQSSAIYEVVAPPPGSDPLEYAARLLQQASGFSLSQCARALEQVVARVARDVAAGGPTDAVMRGLRLTEMLGKAAPVTAASAMVLNTQLPEDVRAQAALVVSDRETHVRWDEVDLKRDSFLLPAIVIARMQQEPVRAVHALVETPAPPPNREYLNYPLRVALRRVCHDGEQGGIARAARLLENLPPSHWSREFVWERTLRLKEFVRLREYLGLEGQTASAPSADPLIEQEHAEIALAVDKAEEEVWHGDIDLWLDEAKGEGPVKRLEAAAEEHA